MKKMRCSLELQLAFIGYKIYIRARFENLSRERDHET